MQNAEVKMIHMNNERILLQSDAKVVNTYTNIFLSWIKSSTAPRLPKIMFMIMKKNAPTLKETRNLSYFLALIVVCIAYQYY